MLVQPKKAIGTLALLDPDIPGAKQLPNGEWAINRAAALLNFPTLGMKAQIPVWSSKSLGDKAELLLNNLVVDQQTITQPAELTQRTTLFVAPGRFQSGSWDLAYRVTRFNQAPEPFTPPFKLVVKLEIPAGQDTDPGQGHSNLHMEFRPPEIVQDGVDKDTAENGVDIWITAKPGSGSNLPYPGIAVGDVIWVSWGGGELVPSDPVTQAQIDDPLNNPIIIHISKDIIFDKGDSGSEGLAVSFFVRDYADNDSEDWCKETRIVVDTGNSRLDAPILEQANGNEYDVDQFDKEQLKLQVFAASPVDYNQGDTIIMYLQGTTLDGESVKVETRQTINKKPPLVVEVLMDNDGARALAKTQGVFFYEVERNGNIENRSRGRFINIIGEPKRLAAPIVEDAVSGALDPDLSYVSVRIPHDSLITPENAIELNWVITLPDSTVYEPTLDWIFPTEEETEHPEGFIVLVPGAHLKPGEGGTLVVSYDVLSEGENGEVVRRPSPPASSLNIGEPQFELVPAILLGEKDGTFEPKDLPNGISEVTCPNPVNNPTLPKDVVHWQLYDAQGGLLFTDNKPLTSLSAGKAVKFPLDAPFVQQYFEAHRGEQLSIRYHIVRDATGKTSYSNPLVFYSGGFANDVTTFDNDKWNGWEPTTPTDWQFVSIGTDRRVKNLTYTNQSDGVVLKKTYHGLIVGKTYSFSVEHARSVGSFALPRLSLSAGGQTIAGPVDIAQTTLQTLSGTFTASAVSVELAVVSHQATGVGNDYEFSSMNFIRLS